MERGQTRGSNTFGVADCVIDSRLLAEVGWKATRERVKVPYAKMRVTRQYPEYHGTRVIPWEAGGPTPQA